MSMTKEQAKAAAAGSADPMAEVTALLANWRSAPQDEDTQAKYRKIMRASSGFQVDDGYARLTPDQAIVLVHFEPTDSVVALWCTLGEEQSFENDRGERITFRPRNVDMFCPIGHGQTAVNEGIEHVWEIKQAYLRVMARDLEGFGEAPERGERGDEIPEGLG